MLRGGSRYVEGCWGFLYEGGYPDLVKNKVSGRFFLDGGRQSTPNPKTGENKSTFESGANANEFY